MSRVEHPFALELDVCFWAHTRAREPVARRLPWTRIRDRLAAPPPPAPSRDKQAVPLWSPTKYTPGAKRNAASVLEVSALVLDYDGTDDLTNAAVRWMDWPFVAHTTWSHGTKPGHRFRIVLPLARPVPGHAWGRVFAWARERDPYIDKSCKDPSRMWLLPFQREGAPLGTSLVHEEPSRCLDVDWEKLPDPDDAARKEAEERAKAARKAASLLRADNPKARSVLLNNDPAERIALGERLGGRLVNRGNGEQVIKGVTCPACSRPSLWWPVVAKGPPKALCEHRGSCGQMFWLDNLEAGRVAA